MKKNILFIIPGLGAGGGEKSLVNLLNQFDYESYNVDLFMLNHEGLFMNLLPKEINVLEIPENLKTFQKSLSKSVIGFLEKANIELAYSRIMFSTINKLESNISKGEQNSWKYLKKTIGRMDKKYDAAIGYLEKTSNYICVDCVQAKRKIGWIHTDIEKLKLDEKFEEEYLKKLDYVVTVSNTCEERLKDKFKMIKNKTTVIENIVSPKLIMEMADEDINIGEKKTVIVSVGRLSHEKGFDIAIKACKVLIQSGIDLIWYVVGDGEERNNLTQLIKENCIESNFKLVGNDVNPYKYISRADVYVQPSRFEGKSIAIEEAKILHKPIVTTNFSTVKDQLNDGVTGIITKMNELSLAEGIERVLLSKDMKDILVNNLKSTELGNEREVNKVYELIR